MKKTTFLLLIAGILFGWSNEVLSQEIIDLEKPAENRFTPVVLTQGVHLDEPMAFEVLDDERVFLIERKGAVKLYNPETKSVSTVATIPVNTKYTSAEGEVREAEEGLVGLTVHPEFEEKPWVYLLYAHPDEPKHVFDRFEFRDGKLVEDSRVRVLEFPVQREECCHTGGGMVWDNEGNLFITVGNNTSNSRSAQTDERPGRSSWDDQRGAANTNDLRGKILRIHPEDDGTYSIPEGNLFPPGTPKTRSEIYSMGHRNAWRISIDSHTGFIYWGEVGPDATEDTEIGPMGYDEFNQARGPGNFGWPYFIGDNQAYPLFDFAADVPGDPKDPMRPVNLSVNNTGLQELPPAQPAFISYPYGVSEQFPLMGSGGRSATGGPIYRQSDFQGAARPFPIYYEGHWFAADLARGWIMAIKIDDEGNYVSMERFLPDYKPAEIIDIKFGPQGDLYVLEYGSRWFRDSDDDKLVRIEYNDGNRTPMVAASADKPGGSLPLAIQFSSEGTIDYDGDPLTYNWEFESEAGEGRQTSQEANPRITFEEAGVYTARLTVTDPDGASNTTSMTLIAGNEPPDIELSLTGNESFFFPGVPFGYDIKVSDTEDGDALDPSHIAVSIDYVSEGFDYAEVIQGQRSVDATTRFAVAQAIMNTSDCGVCHQVDVRSAGPSYTEIASKYEKTSDVIEELATKVVAGGSGVWGEIMMPAHPQISQNDAALLAEYILHIEDQTAGSLPLSGRYLPEENDEGKGTVIVRAAYQDRGAGQIPPHAVEKVHFLRSPSLQAGDADEISGARTEISGRGAGPVNVLPFDGAFIAFHDIDLSGITTLSLAAQARSRNGTVGGTIEVRLRDPSGPLLGSARVDVQEMRFRAPPTATQVQAAGGANQQQQTNRPRRRGPDPVRIEIGPVEGPQNLYLVFKNEEARSIDPLMSLTTIDFLME